MKNPLRTPKHFRKIFLVLSAFFVFSLLSSNQLLAQCPLSAPTLLAVPSNATTCNSLRISFSSVSGATSYQVEYSTNASFSSSSTQFISPTNPVITGLNSGTQYFYRVRSNSSACGLSSPSTSQQLTTDGPPQIVGISNITCSSATITYHANQRLIVGRTITDLSGSIPPIYRSSGGNFLTENLTGLSPNTTYTFTITSYTNTTPACTLVSAPIVFTTTVTGPTIQTASSVVCTGFMANWTMVSGVDGYYIDVADDALFNNQLISNQYIAGDANNFFSATFLNPSTTYYYRVRSEKNGCISYNSSAQTVTTDDIIGNTVVTVQNITCTSADVNWTTVQGATGYDIIIRETGSGIIVQTSNTPGTINLFGLMPNTAYECLATVYKAPDCNAYTVYTFTTDPLPDPPVLPSSYIQQSCSTANVSWNTVTGATGYLLEVSVSPGFSPIIYSSTSTSTNQHVSGLFPNVPYYYRIATITHQTCMGPFSSTENMVLSTPAPPLVINVKNINCFDADLDWISLTGTDVLQVSDNPGFSPLVYHQQLNGGVINVPNLKPATTYYYRVASIELPACMGDFSPVGQFNTPPSTSDFITPHLLQTGSYYETCLPIAEPIGGISDCTNRWKVEVQYFTDPGFSNRPFAGSAAYEWISPDFTGPVPSQFDAGGFTNFVLANGGTVYPSSMMFQPNSYYRILLISGYDYNGTTTWINIDNLDLHICHFTVNGDASDGPIQVCYGADIFAQGTPVAGGFGTPGGYSMEVEEFDPSGFSTGAPMISLISQTDILNGFDIRPHFGFAFAPGYTYTISLNSLGIYYSTKTIQINPVVSSFTINGVQTSPLLICNSSSVTVDGSGSSCTSNIYFLRYAECDASGTPLTPWSTGSVSPANVNNLDLIAFASTRAPIVPNKYYKISWGVGNPMVYSEQIIQVSGPPAIANAGADQIICGYAFLTGTPRTYETVRWSIHSGSGGSFSNANTASPIFTSTPGQIYTLRYTMTTPCGTSFDDINLDATSIPYYTANEAYRTEACNGHRKICLYGGATYTWDAVNLQYTRQSGASTLVLIPTLHLADEIDRNTLPGMGSATHAANPRFRPFGWDNETLKDRSGISLPSGYYYNNNEHIWDQDHLFMARTANPLQYPSNSTNYNTLAEFLELQLGTPLSYNYNINNPFYTPNIASPGIPGSGSYNILSNPAVITQGNIDLDASADYLVQQNGSNSYCAGLYGEGWRLATKTEIGVSESMNNSQGMTVDEAYNLKQQFFSSSVSGSSGLHIWAFNSTGLYHPISGRSTYNSTWIVPDPSTPYYGYCVFKSNPPCGGYYKKEDQVINEDQELVPTKKEVKKQEIKLSFMPNPTSNYVTFNGADDESYNFELIDMQGKLLRSGKIINAEQINLEEYTSGVYLIRLSSHDGAFLGSTRIVRK